MAMMATAALAVRMDNDAGGIERPLIASVGSGVNCNAPIAVKWCETMATVSRVVAASAFDRLSPRPAVNRAQDPNTMPSRIDTATVPAVQPIWAGISKAIMPV